MKKLVLSLVFLLAFVGCGIFRKHTPAPVVVPVTVPEVPPVPIRIALAPIHICGEAFCDTNGATWDWRGATSFILLARQLRGEDITPQIEWLKASGNVARVFVAGVDGPGWEDFTDFQTPYRADDYEAQLATLADRLDTAGIRLEATVVTADRSVDEWALALQKVYNVAYTHPSMFVEWVNEPWVGKRAEILDGLISRGIDRRGVLSSYGIQPDAVGENYQWAKHLDYVTWHSPRDSHYPHNSKDAWGIRNALHVPVVDDEPMGLGPNRLNGGRTQDLNATISHFAICRLFAAGCTIHTQAGIYGLTPGQFNDPTSQAIVDGIISVEKFIPGDVYTGAYSRAGLGDFGLAYSNGDSLVNHAYGSILGGNQFVVVPMPKDGWVPQTINGWNISEMGPTNYILRLTR